MVDGLDLIRREHVGQAIRMLERRPSENIYLLSRISLGDSASPTYGYWQDERLIGVLSLGSNLVVASDGQAINEEMLDAFVRCIGPVRISSAIMGSANNVALLYNELVRRWPTAWQRCRDMRAHQPLLAIGKPANIAPDPRVGYIKMRHWRPYFESSVKMYTEEVGISPLSGGGSYQSYVRFLISNKRAFGATHRRHVWFTANIGCQYRDYCQIQGVWLEPRLRAHGLSAPAMASVVNLCLTRFRLVSLYVNDFNIRARKMYDQVGFEQIGELATVLY